MALPALPWGAARLMAALAAALVASWIAWGWASPPAPLAADAPPSLFSAGRAMLDVQAIAMRPHPAGSADSARVARYLALRLQQLGFVAEQRSYLADDKTMARLREWSRGEIVPTEIVDVVGVLPGRDRTLPPLLLMAHYDTVWGSPGAPDDTAGVATALEVARVLALRRDRARDVVLLFTDAEETGLNGARAFWDGGGLAARIGLVLNLESRGAGGRTQMFETGAGNGGLIAVYDRTVARPSANSLSAFAYRLMPNNTDFSVPRDRGVAGLNFAFLGRAAYYHSPRATIDRLDPATVQDMGDQVLGVAAALTRAPTLPARTADAVYFDLPGGHLVRYAKGAGWLVVVATAAALAAAWAGLRRRDAARIGEALAGVGLLLWTVAHAYLLLRALNLLSGSGAHPNYYDRLAALPRLEWQAALAGLAVLLAAFSLGVWRRRRFGAVPAILLTLAIIVQGGGGVWLAAIVGVSTGILASRGGARGTGTWWGMTAVLALAALVAQARAPEIAWLIAWPALVATLAVAAAAWLPRPSALPLAIATLGAAVVAASILPVAHLVMLGLGTKMPELLVPFVAILLVAFWPISRMRPSLWAGGAVIALVLTAAIVAKGIRTDPIAPTVPAYSLD